MNPTSEEIVEQAVRQMEAVFLSLRSNLRSPTAATMPRRIQILYYGSLVPLTNLANVSVSGPEIVVVPYESSMVNEIVRTISKLYPESSPRVEGKTIHFNYEPALVSCGSEIKSQAITECRMNMDNVQRTAIALLRNVRQSATQAAIFEDEIAEAMRVYARRIKKLTGDDDDTSSASVRVK